MAESRAVREGEWSQYSDFDYWNADGQHVHTEWKAGYGTTITITPRTRLGKKARKAARSQSIQFAKARRVARRARQRREGYPQAQYTILSIRTWKHPLAESPPPPTEEST